MSTNNHTTNDSSTGATALESRKAKKNPKLVSLERGVRVLEDLANFFKRFPALSFILTGDGVYEVWPNLVSGSLEKKSIERQKGHHVRRQSKQ